MSGTVIYQVNTIQRHTVDNDQDYKCIYVIRHGECLSNITWPIENYNDASDTLTELGRAQALASAELLKSILTAWKRETGNAKLYSSTLTRARQTAEIIHTHVGVPSSITYDSRLIEYGGEAEDKALFKQRVASAFSDLENADHDAIVVCHGHTMQALLGICFDADHGKFVANVNNGGICIFHKRELLHWNLTPALPL
jgi:broad specificity phosphatase PhoE